MIKTKTARHEDAPLTSEQQAIVNLSRQEAAAQPEPDPRAWRALSVSLDRRSRRRPSWLITACSAMGAAGLTLLLATRYTPHPTVDIPVATQPAAPVLTFSVEGGARTSATSAAAHGTRLRFSDGSTVAMTPGARARVAALRSAGADVVVEDGESAVHVVHRAVTGWRVFAGPYVVHVTGTRFAVSWNAQARAFSVRMHEGSVRVTGPLLEEGRTLTAGQTLRARPEEGFLEMSRGPQAAPAPDVLHDDEPAPTPHESPPHGNHPTSAVLARAENTAPAFNRTQQATGRLTPRSVENRTRRDALEPQRPATAEAAPAIDPEPAAPDIAAAPTAPAARGARLAMEPKKPPEESPPATPSFAEAVATGAFADVLARAEAHGWQRCLESCNAADLLALADAARYLGKIEQARSALRSLRRRHAGTAQSRTAAFLLGRVALESRNLDEAARWMDIVLSEAGSGRYQALALGYRMQIAFERGESAAARRLAKRYLEAHPGGAHARLAGALVKP